MAASTDTAVAPRPSRAPARLLATVLTAAAVLLGAGPAAHAQPDVARSPGGRGSEGAGPALTLAVPLGPVSLPIYVAASEGHFLQEGVAVRLQPCTSGRDCFLHLQQGRADVATAAELQVALDGARGGDAVILATLSTSDQPIRLVARRSAGIAAAADLRGKRVATIAGTSAHYFLDSWLVYHDVDPAGVQMRPMPADQLLPALQRGEIDALAVWEPIANGSVQQLGSDALVLPGAHVYRQHFNIVARSRVVAERADELLPLLRALQRAQTWIAERPAQALQVLERALQVGPGRASRAGHVYELRLDQSLITTMDAQVRWAAGQGLLAVPTAGAAPASLLRRIDPGLLRQVRPDAVSLAR